MRRAAPAPEDLPATDRLARVRTRLANERTLLAYVRTGLAAVAAGAALVRFWHAPLAQAAGWALVGAGVLVVALGFVRFRLHAREARAVLEEETRRRA